MKYCVSARQPADVINQADEIRLAFRDINILTDLIEDYPGKTIIVEIPVDKEIPWATLQAYNGEKANIILALKNLYIKETCDMYNLKYFWDYPVATWFEFQSMVDFGVSEILISGPLMFQMDKLEKTKNDIIIRAIPNLAYGSYLPRLEGVCGEYIRPENISSYENKIDIFEFKADNLKQEAAIFSIYKDKQWNGNLNLLIKNLNYNVDNRGIPVDFGDIRSICGQVCMEKRGKCHYCEGAFRLATLIDKRHNDWKKGVGLPDTEIAY